jgi:hypothetical protein
MEVQTKTGDGWVHWHVLCDLQGTEWCDGSGWIDLAGFNRRAWSVWRDEFGIGGVDLQLIRSPRGAVGYCAKYLTKPWAAIPQWMLAERSSVRLFGCSKEAGRIIRERLGIQQRMHAGKKTGERRERLPLVDRLAMSGLSCKVVGEQTNRDGTTAHVYMGTLQVSIQTLIEHQRRLQGVRVDAEEFEGGSRVVVRIVAGKTEMAVAAMTGKKSKNLNQCIYGRIIAKLNRCLAQLGLLQKTREEFQRRRRDLWDSWERMQSERAG